MSTIVNGGRGVFEKFPLTKYNRFQKSSQDLSIVEKKVPSCFEQKFENRKKNKHPPSKMFIQVVKSQFFRADNIIGLKRE